MRLNLMSLRNYIDFDDPFPTNRGKIVANLEFIEVELVQGPIDPDCYYLDDLARVIVEITQKGLENNRLIIIDGVVQINTEVNDGV